MDQLFMKCLIYQNTLQTSGETVIKHAAVKNHSQNLPLSQNVKVIAKSKDLGNKNCNSCKLSRGLPSNCCATDESNKL